MSAYDDTEGREDRLHEVKRDLSQSLLGAGISSDPWRYADDILVHGKLSKILEWAQDWRSEIEELG